MEAWFGGLVLSSVTSLQFMYNGMSEALSRK